MKLHDLNQSVKARKKTKRDGRGPGSGSGKFSGRGMKGLGARSGRGVKLAYEGGQMPLFRRIPKRGFNNFEFGERFAPVNVRDLERTFDSGTVVTEELLKARHLANRLLDGVKILGTGTLTKALTVKVTRCSPSAKAKIEAAGGTVEESRPAAPRKIRKGRRSTVEAKMAEKQKAEAKKGKGKGKEKKEKKKKAE